MRASKYLSLLEELFNVRRPTGEIIPYKLVEWQRDYHSHSLNVLGENAQNLLIVKARGISFTWSSAIEAIMTALLYPNTIIPIISQREVGAKDVVKVVGWLIKHANYLIPAKVKETEVVFENGSIIRAYPAANVDAVRGLRLVRAFIDEAAFIPHLEELLVAVMNAMQQREGQVVVGSTFNGRNYFYEMWKKELKGWKKFYLPGFKEEADPHKPLTEQKLTPIVWWYDLARLEEERRRDWRWFAQEYLCWVLDDSTSYFPLNLVMECEDESLQNYDAPPHEGVYVVGVDVATKHDWSAIVVCEKVGEDEWVERMIWWNDRELDLEFLQRKVNEIIRQWQPVLVNIDCTGIGMQMAQNLRRQWGEKVQMVNFSSSLKVATHESKRVKLYLAERLKALMHEKKIKLIPCEQQRKHLVVLDFNLNAPHNEGHADIAWALMLSVMKRKAEVRSPSRLAFATVSL